MRKITKSAQSFTIMHTSEFLKILFAINGCILVNTNFMNLTGEFLIRLSITNRLIFLQRIKT